MHNRLLELQCLAPVECEVVIYDCSKYVSPSIAIFKLSTFTQPRLHTLLSLRLLLPIAPLPISLSLSLSLFPASFLGYFSLSLNSQFFVFSPITEAYHSACQFVSQTGFTQHVVTRAEYAENGSNASRKKFRDWKPQESEKEKQREVSKVKGKQREDDRSQATSTRMTKTRNKLGAGTPYYP